MIHPLPEDDHILRWSNIVRLLPTNIPSLNNCKNRNTRLAAQKWIRLLIGTDYKTIIHWSYVTGDYLLSVWCKQQLHQVEYIYRGFWLQDRRTQCVWLNLKMLLTYTRITHKCINNDRVLCSLRAFDIHSVEREMTSLDLVLS